MNGRSPTLVLSILAALAMASTGHAFTLTGQSTTVVRAVEEDHDDADRGSSSVVPVHEYLSLNAYGLGLEGLSAHAAGWGRFDALFKKEEIADGNLTYGFLNWRSRGYGTHVRAGRQFLTQGVAREQMDGLLFESDIGAGFGATGFAGLPAVTWRGEDIDEDYLWGGRGYWRMPGRLEIVGSYVESREEGDIDKRQVGAEAWAAPVEWLDLAGLGSYDTVSENLFEVTASATVRPTDGISIWGLYDRTVPGDFLSKASIFSVFSEDLVEDFAAGMEAEVHDRVTVLAEYRHSDYSSDGGERIQGQEVSADRFGGEVRLSYGKAKKQGWLSASGGNVLGLGAYRTTGIRASTAFTPGITEVRVFNLTNWTECLYASQDVIVYLYDDPSNGASKSIDGVGAVGYRLGPNLDVEATLLYRTSPVYDSEVQGGIKVDYAFEIDIS